MGKKHSKERAKTGADSGAKAAAAEGTSNISTPPRGTPAGLEWVLCLLLAVLTFIIYAPVRANQFTEYDDNVYVTRNAHVQSGLSAAGLKWALTENGAANWHPLTW